ncbi:4-hydroxy-tetrahydrodipicolinate reductase [Roseomonas elaeocarpi]|uniref:4-hydroxy-tetrahydrodipicolinate reductase n=1 Tax=Roseomonas elaeocarpi TaxID=907779 RepID=A0ABV6JW82_9PROT
MTARIGILGISGRMGRLLVEESRNAGATLSGGVRHSGAEPVAEVPLFPDAATLLQSCDVAIDFTRAEAVELHLAAALAANRPLVLGTSGLSAAQETLVAEAARSVAVVYSANFAPGVNLLFALAERMAAALPPEHYDAEILEMHHRQKVDAPSGTAVALGRAVAAGRGSTLEREGTESGRDGHTGPRRTGTIGFAALRGGQIVGEHALSFTSGTEQIVLEHRSFDRRVYATGAVRAALWAVEQPPGLYDMRHVLGMP